MGRSEQLVQRTTARLFGLLLVASAASGGCGSGSAAGGANAQAGAGGAACPAGSEACACYGNNTCDAPLTCASHLCVNLGRGGSGGQGGSAATGGAPAIATSSRLDLLFMIDNSLSMADKQKFLQDAVPQLLNRLIIPNCVDENDVPKAVAKPN